MNLGVQKYTDKSNQDTIKSYNAISIVKETKLQMKSLMNDILSKNKQTNDTDKVDRLQSQSSTTSTYYGTDHGSDVISSVEPRDVRDQIFHIETETET